MAAAPRATLPPLSGTPLVLGTLALSLAVFMNVLDSSIANVSIPAISGEEEKIETENQKILGTYAADAVTPPS